MNHFLSFMGSLFLLPWTGSTTPLRELQNLVSFSITYEYRVDLNMSEATSSIEGAVNQLRIATLTRLEKSLDDKNDPSFRIVNLEADVKGM